jgi:hypothetical protein
MARRLMAWFVRSLADGDTHRGIYNPGTRKVHARCGIEFTPLPIGLHGNRIAFPGEPPDPDQICPGCACGIPHGKGAASDAAN